MKGKGQKKVKAREMLIKTGKGGRWIKKNIWRLKTNKDEESEWNDGS